MKIEEMFEEFVKERGLAMRREHTAEGEPDQLFIGLDGKNGQFVGMAVCLEKERLFLFYASLGFVVPEEQEGRLLPFLMQVNYLMKTGGFYIDPGSRVLAYRVSHYLLGEDADCRRLMGFLITCASMAADEYAPQIRRQMEGGETER